MKSKRNFLTSAALMLSFVLWTTLIQFVDTAAIGPRGSVVGLSTVNGFFHNLTGTNMMLYHITDWLSLIPVGLIGGFALYGLFEWIKRRSLTKVDRSLFVLGGFYILVLAAFLFFEYAAVNYRPVLIEGVLEASYPSSTTMLVMCVMPTAAIELEGRIKSAAFRKIVSGAIYSFTVFMVALRLISGVHWLTDIIGGALISSSLFALYLAFIKNS